MLRSLARRILSAVDGWYYRRHRLQTLGPVLFLGRSYYHGPELHFEDGTALRENDPFGRLHFNNASIAALGEASLHRTGLRFARMMRLSLYRLAQCAQSDPNFQDVSVFEGVTWIPEHGKVVGFVSKPVPSGLRRLWLAGHFRLLMWAFAPAAQTRTRGAAEPRVYWMTRTALTRNLGKLLDAEHA